MLLLRIDISSQGENTGTAPSSVEFEMKQCTIGRGSDNDVILPNDRSISRRHAQINYEDGTYYLTDTSKLGIKVESTGSPLLGEKIELANGDRVELADGDRLRIGSYVLSISIEEYRSPRPADPISRIIQDEDDDPFARIIHSGPEDIRTSPVPPPEDPISQILQDDDDPISKLFQSASEDIRPPSFPKSPGVEHHPASSSPGKAVEDEDTEPHTESSLPDTRGMDLFARFMEGAGVQGWSFKEEEVPEVMAILGTVFREMVIGLWTMLQARTAQKSEMRVDQTMVTPRNTNPLKYCPRIEDAMDWLVMKHRHPSYLKPVETVHESFKDLMTHQMAVLAGLQASLDQMLEMFDPERFSSKGNDWLDRLLKGKSWAEYREFYDKLKEQASGDYFGKAFVQKYQEQVQSARSNRPKR